MPINKSANPIMNSALVLFLLLGEKNNGNERAITGSIMEYKLKLVLKPSMEINHAVTVVPMFAPNIIPIDSVKEINPAFTKLTNITVVADDD